MICDIDGATHLDASCASPLRRESGRAKQQKPEPRPKHKLQCQLAVELMQGQGCLLHLTDFARGVAQRGLKFCVPQGCPRKLYPKQPATMLMSWLLALWVAL